MRPLLTRQKDNTGGLIVPDWICKYWIQWAFGLVTAGLGVAYQRLYKRAKSQEMVLCGVTTLLRIEIIRDYNKWMELGYCPIWAKENVDDMYEKYHELGGNGVGTRLHDEIMALPTEPPK